MNWKGLRLYRKTKVINSDSFKIIPTNLLRSWFLELLYICHRLLLWLSLCFIKKCWRHREIGFRTTLFVQHVTAQIWHKSTNLGTSEGNWLNKATFNLEHLEQTGLMSSAMIWCWTVTWYSRLLVPSQWTPSSSAPGGPRTPGHPAGPRCGSRPGLWAEARGPGAWGLGPAQRSPSGGLPSPPTCPDPPRSGFLSGLEVGGPKRFTFSVELRVFEDNIAKASEIDKSDNTNTTLNHTTD